MAKRLLTIALTVLPAMVDEICSPDRKVRSPVKVLRLMVELYGHGVLRLDRTLYGLADKVHKGTGAASASRPARA